MTRRPTARVPHAEKSTPRAGVSVLEVIVAMTLGIVLLSAVWAMFGAFLRHQEIDTAQVAQTQIVRGLHQVLTHDLHDLVPEGQATSPPVPGDPAADPGALVSQRSESFLGASSAISLGGGGDWSASSLIGDAKKLKLMSFAAKDDAGTASAEFAPPSARSVRETATTTTPPSKQIVYEFVSAEPRDFWLAPALEDEPLDETEAEAEPEVGLWRREFLLGVRKSASPEAELETVDPVEGLGSPFLVPWAPLRRESTEATASNVLLSEEFANEIVDLRFDYFDGQTWHTTWNSQQAQRLPVLVRLRFDVEANQRKRERTRDRELAKGPDDSLARRRETPAGSPSRLAQELSDDPGESQFDYEFLLFVTHPLRRDSLPSPDGTGEPVPNFWGRQPQFPNEAASE